MAIHSDPEFYVVIGAAVSKAIGEVIEKIFNELQSSIESDIYGAYSSEDYSRTMGLLDSWRREVHGLFGELEFEPSILASDPEGFHHNSPYGWDVRDQIIDILEGGYRAYNAKKGKPIPSRPMWNEFMSKVNTNFDRWMRTALRMQGLAVI